MWFLQARRGLIFTIINHNQLNRPPPKMTKGSEKDIVVKLDFLYGDINVPPNFTAT